MRQFGLIGRHIAHSFSPRYFAEKFEKEQISEAHYSLFPLENIDHFPLLLKQYPRLAGLNVTIPYKTSILPYLDELSPQAKAIGAVNTIQFEAGRCIGHNTDVWGFEQSLRACLKGTTQQQALILGTGGASKAVAYALDALAIPYQLVSRSPKQEAVSYAAISPSVLIQYSIIINTTPLGMSPAVEHCPQLPYHALNSEQLLFDLIYNPETTLFLKKGEEQGCRVKNGLEMLHLQADRAWQIWNNL